MHLVQNRSSLILRVASASYMFSQFDCESPSWGINFYAYDGLHLLSIVRDRIIQCLTLTMTNHNIWMAKVLLFLRKARFSTRTYARTILLFFMNFIHDSDQCDNKRIIHAWMYKNHKHIFLKRQVCICIFPPNLQNSQNVFVK